MQTIRALLLAALACVGSLGTAAQVLDFPKVDIEFDERVDFSAFKTFRWKDTQEPAPNATVHSSVTWNVERGLEKKRLAKQAEGAPDLFVRYYTEAKRGLRGTPSQTTNPSSGTPSGPTTNVDFHRETQGTLTLELFRATDGQRVWKAQTPWGAVDTKKIDDDIASAVRLLLAKYPPPAGRR
jgi:hypothetical protein